MEKIQNERFLQFKFLSSLKANPNQSLAAFVQSEIDIKNNQYRDAIFVYDRQKVRRIIRFKKRSSFIFETESSLLFPHTLTKKEEKYVKDSQKTLYYRYDLLTSTLSKAYEFNFPVSIIDVLGDQLLLKASLSKDQHQLYLLKDDQREAYIKQAKKDKLYETIEEIPFYSNQQGFVANQRTQIFLYDTQNQTIKPLVDSNFDVRLIHVSKDKSTIFYTGQDMKGVRSLTTHIFSYHMKTKETSILYHEDAFSFAKLFTFGQKIIVAASDMKTYGINQNYDFYQLVDKKLIPFVSYGLSISNSIGSDVRLGEQVSDVLAEDYYVFVATVNDHSEVKRLSSNGKLDTIVSFDGSLDSIASLPEGLLAIGQYKQKLQELYFISDVNHAPKVLTGFNKKTLQGMYVAKPKPIILHEKTPMIHGWVLYPKDYDSTKKYPAILDIHGGPKTVYGSVYYHEMQVWANQGYFVMFANPRGSDGKGDLFSDIRGKYGTIDYQDLMDFVDTILKKIKAIDHERLGVTGGSYGGYMTNWIIGHTNRFKAACTQRSIANFLSFHSTSDIGFYFSKDQTSGHPLSDTDKLWEQSPLKYANHIQTPTLIIHSDQDYRCPIEQAMQLFTILKERGVESRFVWFKGENHELSRSGLPQARLKRLDEILQWFNTHLTA